MQAKAQSEKAQQEMHGVQRKNQADSSDDSRSNHPRVRKFCVESQDTENQKHEENIRLHDSRKKSLPRGKLESCARSILQRECHLRPVEARNRSPVQLPQQIIG